VRTLVGEPDKSVVGAVACGRAHGQGRGQLYADIGYAYAHYPSGGCGGGRFAGAGDNLVVAVE